MGSYLENIQNALVNEILEEYDENMIGNLAKICSWLITPDIKYINKLMKDSNLRELVLFIDDLISGIIDEYRRTH